MPFGDVALGSIGMLQASLCLSLHLHARFGIDPAGGVVECASLRHTQRARAGMCRGPLKV